MIARAIAEHPVDLVHLHGVDFHAYLPDGLPVVVTLHLPMAFYSPAALLAPALRICVSESQRRTCAVEALTIPNGIAVRTFRMRWTWGRYALALGRLCPEKGFEARRRELVSALEVAGVGVDLLYQIGVPDQEAIGHLPSSYKRR